MSKKYLHQLTELQLAVLQEVWKRGEATVLEVHQGLSSTHHLARKTVGTLLMRLEQYGFLRHREVGREYVYGARVSRAEVREAMLGRVLSSLFEGDVPQLVSHALDIDDIAPGDIDRIRELLKAKAR